VIALLAAAALATPSPSVVLARYEAALARLREPRVFAVEYAVERTGARTIEQTHRIFRSGNQERDEMIAVNGTRATRPTVRIFHNRPFRYSLSALAPRPTKYAFRYAGSHKAGKHVDYVFHVTPKGRSPRLAFTQVTIDGVSFLPSSVAFATPVHEGRGAVTFAKAGKWWMPSGAGATAQEPGGIAHERLIFYDWRFPTSLPPSTFAAPRPLPTTSVPPAAAMSP
jgi:hypothetical protein